MREELSDLIDDTPIDESEGEDSDASEKHKRTRSDDDLDDQLEDDDFDLIEENLGITVERKRFKRLRRIEDDDSDDEEEQPGNERDAIANELFENDSGVSDDCLSEKSQKRVLENFDEERSEREYSDADDGFIVGDDNCPIYERKRAKKLIYADPALQKAQEIFGVDFDYEEFGKYGDDNNNEEEDDEYNEGDHEDEDTRQAKKTAKKSSTKKSIFDIYEPSELKRGYFTDTDNEIRNKDIPERMQLRAVPVTPVPACSDELDREAEWIYKQALCKRTISVQDSHSNEIKKRVWNGPQTIDKTKKVLELIRNQNFEVPFISFYRKECVYPELNINDLWKIYKFDGQWCQLHQRKNNLLVLFDNMRNYQLDATMKNPHMSLYDNVRIIKDKDIDRLKSVETNEELNDVHNHFALYYSHMILRIKEANRQKERIAKHEERIQKRRQQLKEAKQSGEAPPPEDDIDAEDNTETNVTLKQAIRSGRYEIYRKAGLDQMAKKFGLSPEDFAENLHDNYQRHEVHQQSSGPLTVASEFCCPQFKTPEMVLKASQTMVAIQLAREPLLRKSVREIYMERAKINVRPTKKGIKEIDESHPIYSMKYLKNKPVRQLIGDQFLKLVMAEEEKLITITLSDTIESSTSSNYIDDIKQLYCRDEFSKNVQDWNALRIGSVEMAIKQMLIPDLKKELRRNLLNESKECIMTACCRKMYDWIKVAPYTSPYNFNDEIDEKWDTSKGLRVMGVSYVPDRSQAAFACIIASNGEFADFIKLPHLTKRKNSFRKDEKIKKKADLIALQNFIATNCPHVIVLGGESREATILAEDLKECVKTLINEENFPPVQVEIAENDLAKIYANSNKGLAEFRDYPPLLREAISLARRLQDPLVEFSHLCTSDEDILCLNYHTYQNQLSKEELLENLYQEFVNRVCEVGVDVNEPMQRANAGNLLQFISGLGVRKAEQLKRQLKRTNQRLENRTQLITSLHMGPTVFMNCAGFIKIDTDSLDDCTETYVEVLDSTRIHPEVYDWVRKMAIDAMEYEHAEDDIIRAMEEILKFPEQLNDLDLDAFAEELERQGFGNKSITVHDIRAELIFRNKNLRTPYQSPTPEKLFEILTKETSESLYIGKLIMAVVSGIAYRKPQSGKLDPVRNNETGLWQCSFCLQNDFPEISNVWNHFDSGRCPGKATGVQLQLDNGISGYLHVDNLSDSRVVNILERIYIGQTIHCRVMKIEPERFRVECTSKSSDLRDEKRKWRPKCDSFYDTEAEDKDNKAQDDSKKIEQRHSYIKRVIVHPQFHNITYAEGEKMMQTLKQGEAIIRPSSKGSDHLTVTWKVMDNIHMHMDVREEGKVNTFLLGSSLWIGSEEFEDLDEILVRHVNPMATNANEIMAFKHYDSSVMGQKDKAEEILRQMKRQNPGEIPYIISAAKVKIHSLI